MTADWIDMELGEFAELKRGYDLPKREREIGIIPLVSSSGTTDLHSVAKVKGPGVITVRYGTIGQVFYVEEDFWPLNTTLYVQNFKNNNPLFVYYLLKTISYEDYSDKAAVPGINRNHLHKAKIRVPVNPSHQQEIAEKLWVLDSKIELNRQTNQTLEQIAQAIFKSWFVDFEPTRAKIAALEAGGSEDDALLAAMQTIAGSALFATDAADADAQTQLARLQTEHPEQYATLRATAELFPSAMQESELGEIPEGWSVVEVTEFGSVICGKTPPKKNPEYYGGDTPFLKIPDMHGRMFITEVGEFLSDAGAGSQRKKAIPKNSVCVSCIATVGLVSI